MLEDATRDWEFGKHIFDQSNIIRLTENMDLKCTYYSGPLQIITWLGSLQI